MALQGVRYQTMSGRAAIYCTVKVVSVFSSHSWKKKQTSEFPKVNYLFKCSVAVIEVFRTSFCFFAFVSMHMHLPTTVCFFVFNGSIQDIRACQRLKRKRWESSVFKGQESHVELPLFTPVTKWTGLDTNFLPMRS